MAEPAEYKKKTKKTRQHPAENEKKLTPQCSYSARFSYNFVFGVFCRVSARDHVPVPSPCLDTSEKNTSEHQGNMPVESPNLHVALNHGGWCRWCVRCCCVKHNSATTMLKANMVVVVLNTTATTTCRRDDTRVETRTKTTRHHATPTTTPPPHPQLLTQPVLRHNTTIHREMTHRGLPLSR